MLALAIGRKLECGQIDIDKEDQMIDFQISAKGKLSVFRSCPECLRFLAPDSNLRQDRFLKQKQKKDGSWYHTAQAGRALHKIATRKEDNE